MSEQPAAMMNHAVGERLDPAFEADEVFSSTSTATTTSSAII